MKHLLVFAFCLSFVLDSALYAQSPLPSENLRQSVEREESTKVLEERLRKNKREKDKKLKGIEKNTERDFEDAKTIFLKELMFSQSDVLPQSFFEELKQKYENKKVSVNDIFAIVNSINNEYISTGCISSRAFLLKQNTTSGRLFINLVEGTTDKKKFKGANRLWKGEEIPRQDSKNVKIVFLKKLMFSQSDILPQSFFDALRQKYENKRISANDIYDIINAVNNEYMLKGNISSQAFLLKQDMSSGKLFISLVEGVIGKINLKGADHTSEKYIKKYINFENEDVFNANNANRQMMNFNSANDAKARIVLAPGKVFGVSDIDIVIEEPNWRGVNAFTDNAGQDETGIIRYGLHSTVRSLTGYRDILSFGGVLSEGSRAAFLSYEIPGPFLGFRMGAGFNYSDTQIINGYLEPLNVKGDYYGAYVFLKRPLYVREKAVSNLTFNVGSGRGASSIMEYTTQDAKSDYLSLTGDNTIMTSSGYLYNSLTYTQGLRMIEGETEFEKIAYYGEFYCGIVRRLGAVLKLKGQAAFDVAPSSEQFTIGGDGTARGYDSGMYMSKNGLAAAFEIDYNLNFFKSKFFGHLSAFIFCDYAMVFLDREIDPFAQWSATLLSAGGGIKIGISKYIEGSFIWAFPLSERDKEEIPGLKFMFAVQGRI
jgi:hemolysin activation/secretion protein